MSPIIATLLLIAISVASGIVVYVFTNGLAANLTKSGGNQVTEQLSMDAYSYTPTTSVILYVRNTGTGILNITSLYYDGAAYAMTASTFASTSCHISTASGLQVGMSCSPGQTGSITLAQSATAETTHAVKIVTSNGAIFTYNVVAGQTG